MANLAGALAAKKLAGYAVPALAGGAIVFALFLGAKSCSGDSDKPLYDSVQAYHIADSLLQLKQDSLATVKLDTIEYPIFLDRYHKIVVIDSATLRIKANTCDSLLELSRKSDASLKAALRAKESLIAILNKRIANCQKEQGALIDSAHKMKKPPVHFEVPAIIHYGLDMRLGGGMGALGALEIEGNVRYGRTGIFLQAGAFYQDKPRFMVIGGISYRIGGN